MGRSVMNPWQRILHKPFFIRLLYWEYWSMTAVYALIYPVFLWLCIRCGWKFFFTAANPKIRYGGFLMESKKEIYDTLPQGLYPPTILVRAGTGIPEILEQIKRLNLSFPLIAKPDIGMRGLAAKRLDTEDELIKTAPKFEIDFLIQEFIPYKNEVGIFYYRYPGQPKGSVSGIVGKEFLSITGDGKSSLRQLLQRDRRFILQLDSLQEEYGDKLDRILLDKENEVLIPYGNHARGSKFLDYSYLIDDDIITLIDNISRQVPDFFYGRLDLRYNNWEELKQGKNFSIIELNGAGSEPTHIYDPRHSLFFAWKEIIRHWIILWQISRKNHQLGFPYMSFREGFKMFRANRAYVTKLREVHEALLKGKV